MIADSSLLVQMQLALIGIVLVTGLFYLWRSLCRIEDKVTRISTMCSKCPCMPSLNNQIPVPAKLNVSPPKAEIENDFRVAPLNFSDANLATDELMKQVFGNIEEEDNEVKETSVVIEDVVEEQQPNADDASDKKVGHYTPDVDIDSKSDITDNTNPLSKSKLTKMNVEELKNLCIPRGIDVNGNKKVLIDRLLGLSRD